jgi:hypothetical protein
MARLGVMRNSKRTLCVPGRIASSSVACPAKTSSTKTLPFAMIGGTARVSHPAASRTRVDPSATATVSSKGAIPSSVRRTRCCPAATSTVTGRPPRETRSTVVVPARDPSWGICSRPDGGRARSTTVSTPGTVRLNVWVADSSGPHVAAISWAPRSTTTESVRGEFPTTSSSTLISIPGSLTRMRRRTTTAPRVSMATFTSCHSSSETTPTPSRKYRLRLRIALAKRLRRLSHSATFKRRRTSWERSCAAWKLAFACS